MGGLFSTNKETVSEARSPRPSGDYKTEQNEKELNENSTAENNPDALNETVKDSPNISGTKRNKSLTDEVEDVNFPMTKRIKPYKSMTKSVTSPPSLSSPTTSWWCKLLVHKDGRVIEVAL